MICYKDRSYCMSGEICENYNCTRKLTTKDMKKAVTLALPISMADFRDTDQCPGFQPKESKDD